jgi:hypothetical protein
MNSLEIFPSMVGRRSFIDGDQPAASRNEITPAWGVLDSEPKGFMAK